METLIEKVERLEGKNNGNRYKDGQRSSRECYNCHKLGHYARECPDEVSELQGKSRDTRSEEKELREDPLHYRKPALAAKERSCMLQARKNVMSIYF